MEYLALGYTPTEAGLKAGYAESYAKTDIRRKLTSPNFIAKLQKFADKMPEARTTLAKLRLPMLYDLEEKFYQKCENDPVLLAKYGKVAERDYKLAGLLKEDVKAQILVPVNVAIQVQDVLQAQQPPLHVDTVEVDKLEHSEDSE